MSGEEPRLLRNSYGRALLIVRRTPKSGLMLGNSKERVYEETREVNEESM